MHDTKTQKPRSVEVTLSAANAIENNMVAKLGIRDMILRLEEKKNAVTKKEKTVTWYDKKEIKQERTKEMKEEIKLRK